MAHVYPKEQSQHFIMRMFYIYFCGFNSKTIQDIKFKFSAFLSLVDYVRRKPSKVPFRKCNILIRNELKHFQIKLNHIKQLIFR